MTPDRGTRPSYALYDVVVRKEELVSPRLKRLTVEAGDVPGLRADLPGQWVKVFVGDGEGRRLAGRAYTVRRLREVDGSIDIDFVLHGDEGRVSAWAARAVAGDRLEISAPHSKSGFAIEPSEHRYLLVGDETGLPAIASILEALPPSAHATVLVEIADRTEEQLLETKARLDLHWLHRDGAPQVRLADALPALGLSPPGAVFVAAESGDVGLMRSWLKRQGYSGRLHASGYWKRGVADHRDADGD